MPTQPITSHSGQVYSTRHGGGWVDKPASVKVGKADGGCITPVRHVVRKRGKAKASAPTGHVGNTLLIPPRIPSHQLDWSISGLGAFRSYKAWPGRVFPTSRAVYMLDTVDKSERQ